ncbi:MAG: hypothetical protein WBA34_07905, partial [Candidatus Deferrimicrobiaceae bacterium]
MAAQFGPYQRSFCNKCHPKDCPSSAVSPSVTWDPGSRGIPLRYARDLRPLTAGSARWIGNRLVGTLLSRIPE